MATERIKILVVDDCPTNRILFEHIFSKEGFEVDLADGGQAALDLWGPAHHAVVTDLQMPEMDGREMARALRGRGCGIPIIACSAAGELKGSALDAGCNDFFGKPIDRRALIDAVLHWVGVMAEAA